MVHTHSVGLLWPRDLSVVESSAYTAHNIYKTQTSMSMHLVGFEPAIPASQRPQTCALDRAATAIEIFYVQIRPICYPPTSHVSFPNIYLL